VGSTTDYRPHIAVVEPFSKQQARSDRRVKKVDSYVQFREIPLLDLRQPRDEQCLRRVLGDIDAYGRENKTTTHCIGYECDRQFGMSLLGLNKDYQDRHWTATDTEECGKRLDRFIDAWLSRNPADARADLVRCLGFIASAVEADVCMGKNGFDPGRCRLH